MLTGKVITVRDEQYRMHHALVPVVPALIILFIFISPACAGTGPGNLSISSSDEEGGYIHTTLTTGGVADEAGYLACWLTPVPGDCSAAHLLAWQILPAGAGNDPITLKGPVPYGVIPGTYEVRVQYGMGKTIPDSCDKGTGAVSRVEISTPGKGLHDMAATLPAAERGITGPDYRIDALSGVDTAVRMTPSSLISPVVTISNTGSDDPTGQPVEVHAYLGSEELIPVSATLGPLKGGETKETALSYRIPATISQRSYPFFLIIDPRGVTGPPDAATNLKRTGGQMMVRAEGSDAIAEHGCGCT